MERQKGAGKQEGGSWWKAQAPKRQRLPLSVARGTMKKQKEREQKLLQESSILGRFGVNIGSGTKKAAEKRKPEDKVLKSTEGNFRNGVLDVKHLLKLAVPRESDNGSHGGNKGKKKKGGKNSREKKGDGKRSIFRNMELTEIDKLRRSREYSSPPPPLKNE